MKCFLSKTGKQTPTQHFSPHLLVVKEYLEVHSVWQEVKILRSIRQALEKNLENTIVGCGITKTDFVVPKLA